MKCYKIFVLIFFVFEGVAALPSPPDGLLRADGFSSSSRANTGDGATRPLRRIDDFDRKAKRAEALLSPSPHEASQEAGSDDSEQLEHPSLRTVEAIRRRQETMRHLPLRIQDQDAQNEQQLQTAIQRTDDVSLVKRGKLAKAGIAAAALATVGGLYALLKKLVFDKNKGKPDEGPYPQPADSSPVPPPTPRSLDSETQDDQYPLISRSGQSKMVKGGIAVAALGTVGGLYALLKKLVFDKNKGKPDEGPYPQPGDASPTPPPTPRSLESETPDDGYSLIGRDNQSKMAKAGIVGAVLVALGGLSGLIKKLVLDKNKGTSNEGPHPQPGVPSPTPRSLDNEAQDDQYPLISRSGQSKMVKGGIAVAALATVGGLYALLKKLVFDKNKGKPDEGPYPQPGGTSPTPPPTPRSLDDEGQASPAKRDRKTRLIKAGKLGGAAATIAALYYGLYKLISGKSDGRQTFTPGNDAPGSESAPAPKPRGLNARHEQVFDEGVVPGDDGASTTESRAVKRAITLHQVHNAAKGGALVISLGGLYYLVSQMLKDTKAERQSQQGHHAPGPASTPVPRYVTAPRAVPAPVPRSLDEEHGQETGAEEVSRQESDLELSERGVSGAQKGLLRIGGATTAMMTMASLGHAAKKQKQRKHKHKQGKENAKAKAMEQAQAPQPQKQIPVLRPRSLHQGNPCLTNKQAFSDDLGHDEAQLDKRLKGNWGRTVGGGVVGMCGLGMESLYAANALKKQEERQQKTYQEAKKYGPALMIKKPSKERR